MEGRGKAADDILSVTWDHRVASAWIKPANVRSPPNAFVLPRKRKRNH